MRKIARTDSSLTAACGFRKSIWHRDAQGVFSFSGPPSTRFSLLIPSKTKSRDQGRHTLSLLRLRLVSYTVQRLVLSHGGCEWLKVAYGWEGRQQQQHHSRSISIRKQTMWEPMCPRMQMPLSCRDGLCDGEQEVHAD